jgi:hypothetical protein
MPTPYMEDNLEKGDFSLIDGQHIIEVAKRIYLIDNWDDPNG